MEDAEGRGVVDATDKAMAIAHPEQRRLQRLRAWLEMNGVQRRGCEIKRSGGDAGLGVFASEDKVQGVLMVVPLALAITPTSVMQDADLGGFFMELMEEGDVDDRLVVILFLVIERLRGQFSSRAAWLDMMPSVFGTTVWFSEDELLELKGTHLLSATKMRLKSLKMAFEKRAKPFVEVVLSCVATERTEINFEDFLWANSIFWARAKNMPCPRSVLFPDQRTAPPVLQSWEMQLANVSPSALEVDRAISESSDLQISTSSSNESIESTSSSRETSSSNGSACVELEEERSSSPSHADENSSRNVLTVQRLDGAVLETECKISTNYVETSLEDESALRPSPADGSDTVENSEAGTHGAEALGEGDYEVLTNSSRVYVEGLVPGIDFCNHDLTALALWEVDGPEGYETGVPNSMYLVTLRPEPGVPFGEEICINYGPKGNEELLFSYGFVLEDNPDDYLMIYFPVQALEATTCKDYKKDMIERLNLPLRWIIPSSELKRGFYEECDIDSALRAPSGHSWAGRRKESRLANKLVFSEDLLTSLRIISMQEDEACRVAALLEEVTDPEAGRFATDADMRAAVWEVCGNTGSFQLLIDMLSVSITALEEGTGTEAMDAELLAKDSIARSQIQEQSHPDRISKGDGGSDPNLLSDNKRAAVIYRMCQKNLARRFLREAEMALEVCLDYVSD